jgi:integrase
VPIPVASERALAAVGLPAGTRFHELRHFYASLLIDAGESVKVVQSRLGHATAEETLNTYSNPRELQPMGEKSQVTSSAQIRSGSSWPVVHAA